MLATLPTAQIQERIAAFVAHLDEAQAAYFARMDYSFAPPVHEAQYLSDKWVRIVTKEQRGGQLVVGSAVAFVALVDYQTKALGQIKAGDIHKPDNFKRAAKHARGSVFAADFGNATGPSGNVRYL